MRILIVHNVLWAHYKAKVFEALAEQAATRPDTHVHVVQIARNERARAGLEASQPDAPTYRYPYTLLFDRFLEDVSLTEKTGALLRQARAFRPDVINLTGYYDPAQLVLLLYARLRGIRVVIQNESTAVDLVRNGPREWLKRRILGLADGFFCFGTRSVDYLLRLGVLPEQILVRQNAVVDNRALARVHAAALPDRAATQQALGLRPRNFCYVGRLATPKNLPALLDAFAAARRQAPDGNRWGLLLLGDGDQKEALARRITDLNLTDAVRLVAGAPWYHVPAYLALADVLVLPSLSEPWGLVVNEAMVCGLPVVVSDRCGCADDLVRPGENGFIFAPEEPAALTDRLLRCMDPQTDLPGMGAVSRQLIAAYAPDVVAGEMLDGFARVARR